jgi:hypothetical protein
MSANNKSGQVTIFVVLGIVLVLVVALFLVARHNLEANKPSTGLADDSDAKQIQLYVSNCLSSVSEQAIKKAGLTGGNLFVDDLTISPIPTDSDALIFSPAEIPYWHYLKDCNQATIGCLASNQPPLCKPGRPCVVQDSTGPNSIEEQLSRYAEEQLSYCINGFKDFQDNFEIQEQSEPVVDVIIGDGEVVFYMDYPLEIKTISKNVVESINEFSTSQEINFKEIYEVANAIIKAERDTNLFERATLNLITVYSGVDGDLLPPTSDVKLFNHFNKEFWIRSEVERDLQQDVLPYVALVQFQNTIESYNPVFTTDSSSNAGFIDGFWSSFDIKLTDLNITTNIKSDVIYTYEPIFLEIGNSELIEPKPYDTGGDLLGKLLGAAITDYRFEYDLSYPLVISLNQDDALNGEGFEFNFAVEVNIRKNHPVNSEISPVEVSTPFMTGLDSQAQLVDKKITIETFNKHTGEVLPNVIISYYCGYMFDVGATGLSNGDAVFEGKLPFCQFGGKIILEKNGYLTAVIDYENLEGGPDEYFTAELWPAANKEIEILKRTKDNIDTIASAGAGAISLYDEEATVLSGSEKIIFNIERVKENSFESNIPLVGFVLYRNQSGSSVMTVESQAQNIQNMYDQGLINQSLRDEYLASINEIILPTSDEGYSLDFVPGTYLVEAYLMYEGNITIPAETKDVCKGICTLGNTNSWGECNGLCVGTSEDLDLEETSFGTWMSGGAIFNFTLNEHQVYNGNDITFYVLEMAIPEDWDDMIKVKSIDEYQIGKENFINPLI